MIDKPGCYPDIPHDVYLSDPCPEPSVSRSVIKDIIKCPARAWWNHPRLNQNLPPEEPQDKFDIGTASHALFLQGTDKAAVIEADDWRTKAAKEARDDARKNGKIPLLIKHYNTVDKMVDVASETLSMSELALDIRSIIPEVTYIWNEGETWCRTRLDAISRDYRLIIDYKTTSGSADPEDYSRIAMANGLDIQESFYRRGVEAIHGVVPRFVFMVQEIQPPYLCSFIELDPMTQDMGNRKVERGLDLWRDCRSNNYWPGYPTNVMRMEAKPWDLAKWEMTANTTEVRTSDGIPF